MGDSGDAHVVSDLSAGIHGRTQHCQGQTFGVVDLRIVDDGTAGQPRLFKLRS